MLSLAATLLLVTQGTSSLFTRRDSPTLPDYVTDYAPLVYIDVNDPFLPSDIAAQVTHTQPELNFTLITSGPEDLSLSNLAALNEAGDCSFNAFDECDVYLTSRDSVPNRPRWLNGTLPNPSTGETEGAVSATVIVNDHGDSNTLDAYYFYFYAFNLGQNLSNVILGNHVGDWEHSMLRFVDGEPQTIWYSAHDGGFTYTYDAVQKNGSRPIVYSSLGGHANYATPGLQTRSLAGGAITLNDTTSQGPLWDPVLSAYFYTFSPTSQLNGTFTPAISTGAAAGSSAPVDWLYFLGRWGDKQYPESNPAQINVANLTFAYEDGPTGPLGKDLNRTGTCPDSEQPCMTTSKLPMPSGTTMPMQTISRTYSSMTISATGDSGSATSSSDPSTAHTSSNSASNRPITSSSCLLTFAALLLCWNI